jgi:hypothetical protein
MSSRKKKRRGTGSKSVPPKAKKRAAALRVAVLAVLVAVAAIVVVYGLKPTDREPAAGPVSGKSGDQSEASPGKTEDFQNLIGRWLRPDGGYVIEIRGIESGGRLEAAYLNPRPINVSRAQASWDNGAQKVFIELRDTGYPGSTYTLIYNPQQDMLAGIYYQAAMNQSFEVVFLREK